MAPQGYLVPTRALESRGPERLRMGATLEKRSGSVYKPHVCAWPHPFSARGGFPGNAEDTAGHSSSPHTHADDPPQVGATPTSSYAHVHARPISKKWSGQNRTGCTGNADSE